MHIYDVPAAIILPVFHKELLIYKRDMRPTRKGIVSKLLTKWHRGIGNG